VIADSITLGFLFGSDGPLIGPEAEDRYEAEAEAEEAKEAEAKAAAEQAEAKAAVEAAKAKADAKDAGKEADSDIDSVIDHLTKIVTIAKNGDDGEISGNKTIIISALSTAEGS